MPSWPLFAVTLAGIVAVPFLFESYTFYLFTINEPVFYVYSGARLWVFLASVLILGFILGRAFKPRLNVGTSCIAIAIAILVTLLYQICDERQCYYSGPDGAGWPRLGTLLFVTASVGLLIGSKSRGSQEKNNFNAVMFGTITAVFLGYYPVALLFGTFMTYEMSMILLAFASMVPFLFGGIVSSLFSGRKSHTACSAILGLAVLSALFINLRPSGAPLLAIMLGAAVAASLAGSKTYAKYLSRAKAQLPPIIFPPIIALFAIGAVHPYLDAPMNMSMDDSGGILAPPTYYVGAYHEEPYFATKRVEVSLNLEQFDGRIKEGDFVLAGIGAQSPNCCKDGLDYGYRADILFTDSGRYLVARAWETCDLNIACSGFSWASVMHKALIPLPGNTSSVMLAMEWDKDDTTAHWYYKTGGNWSKYSSFVSPEIENPYFNLGVIWVNSYTTNPPTSNANFYQAGVSTQNPAADYGEITFECISYYDDQGTKQCVPETSAVKNGNSHWKVMWKWGLQHENAVVSTEGSTVKIALG